MPATSHGIARSSALQVRKSEMDEEFEIMASRLSSSLLLAELVKRGGATAALAEAALLCERKAQDYNDSVPRESYFPFGQASYTQMIYTKALRLLSLTTKEMNGGTANFEGVSDTLKDIINYASFNAAWLKRTGD